MLMRSIDYGSNALEYCLRFSDRETVEISVHPDRSILVVAPEGSSTEDVERVLRRRARWILRQQRYFEQFVPRTPPRQYVSGETHLYLGRQYRLKIVEAEKTGVKLIAGRLKLTTPTPADTVRNGALLTAWYLGRARVKFPERLERLFPAFQRHSVTLPTLAIRPLARRWGSLSPGGRMTLNLDLIRAPTACIDYVIAHELCHLVHRDHSSAFFRLLDRIMPDWEKRKKKLELTLV